MSQSAHTMAFELVDIRGNGAQLIRKSCSQPALFDLGQGQDDLATGRRFGFQTGHQADPSTSYPSSQGSRSRPPGPLAAWFASWRRKPKHQPAAHSLAQREEAYDVYVAARPFESFGGDLFQRLPAPVHDLLLDVGVCHFMAIFKDRSSGRMLQFDFGPVGGDIAIDGPLGDVLKEDRQHSKRKNMQTSSSALTLIRQETGSLGLPDANQARGGRPGEIRETLLGALPEHHVYVGSTHVCLDAIRTFNARRPLRYQLSDNDCRHFVNGLVNYTTGFDGSTLHLLRHRYAAKCASLQHSVQAGPEVSSHAAMLSSCSTGRQNAQTGAHHHLLALTASMTTPTITLLDTHVHSASSNKAGPGPCSDAAALTHGSAQTREGKKAKVPAVWQRPLVTGIQGLIDFNTVQVIKAHMQQAATAFAAAPLLAAAAPVFKYHLASLHAHVLDGAIFSRALTLRLVAPIGAIFTAVRTRSAQRAAEKEANERSKQRLACGPSSISSSSSGSMELGMDGCSTPPLMLTAAVPLSDTPLLLTDGGAMDSGYGHLQSSSGSDAYGSSIDSTHAPTVHKKRFLLPWKSHKALKLQHEGADAPVHSRGNDSAGLGYAAAGDAGSMAHGPTPRSHPLKEWTQLLLCRPQQSWLHLFGALMAPRTRTSGLGKLQAQQALTVPGHIQDGFSAHTALVAKPCFVWPILPHPKRSAAIAAAAPLALPSPPAHASASQFGRPQQEQGQWQGQDQGQQDGRRLRLLQRSAAPVSMSVSDAVRPEALPSLERLSWSQRWAARSASAKQARQQQHPQQAPVLLLLPAPAGEASVPMPADVDAGGASGGGGRRTLSTCAAVSRVLQEQASKFYL